MAANEAASMPVAAAMRTTENPACPAAPGNMSVGSRKQLAMRSTWAL